MAKMITRIRERKDITMVRRRLMLPLVGLLIVSLLGIVSATPTRASGAANWQVTFAGTGPGFGFWGWCDFGGATSSSSGLPSAGTTGDCQYAEYVHVPGAFSGTCEVSLNLADESGQPAWLIAPSASPGISDFFISGTAVTHPASETGFCATLPGSPPTTTFNNYDSLLPVAPGHLNLSGDFGTTELQIQETVIP